MVDCCMLWPHGPGMLVTVPRVGCGHLIEALWIGASVPLAVVRVVQCRVVPQRREQCGSLSGGVPGGGGQHVCRGELGPLGFRSGRVRPVDVWS
jgi:hypothetical protein